MAIIHFLLSHPLSRASSLENISTNQWTNLPLNLQFLSFGRVFNQPVDNLPSSLLQLSFGIYFEQSVDHLPTCLTQLKFHHRCGQFNLPITHLPSGLLKLTLPFEFNHPIDNLPSHLTTLVLPAKFARQINQLPFSLTTMLIADSNRIPFHQQSNFKILQWPPALDTLYIEIFQPLDLPNLPNTLKTLIISTVMHPSLDFEVVIQSFPSSLTRLNIPMLPCHTSSWNRLTALKSLSIDSRLDSSSYPPMTTELVINATYQHSVDDLPESITALSLNTIITAVDHLPSRLTHLNIGTRFNNFNLPVDHLPPSITHLVICGSFNCPVDHLPRSLLHLDLMSVSFNQPVDHLPSSLTYLALGTKFNQPVDHLPASLTCLKLRKFFTPPISLSRFLTSTIHYFLLMYA